MDKKAFYNITYGLYLLTAKENGKDNGCIINSVMQISSNPHTVAVSVNKANYTHDVIKQTGKLNVCCLDQSAPFSLFQNFGFRSGRDCDKMEGYAFWRTPNGLACLSSHVNAFISLSVDSYVDMGTHGLFLCTATDARAILSAPTMTYDYYQQNVKPKAQKTSDKKTYVCSICGYKYEGESLPEDFVCPWCKHGAEDFTELK